MDNLKLPSMQKILVVGSGGSGKTTFSIQLAERLGVDVIHMDVYFWRSNWVPSSQEEFLGVLEPLMQRDAWIMDGNYSGTLVQRIAYADTVIFLDIPRFTCLWRVVMRRLKYWRKVRPDLAEGCYEKLDWDFIRWIWNFSRRSRPRILEVLSEHSQSRHIFILKSAAEIRAFLQKVGSDVSQGV